jgi:hypothetical protein
VDRNRLIRDINGTAAGPAVRLTASVVAAELSRITPRDRYLLDLLRDHQVLTTEHLADLAFGTVGRARHRLNTLLDRAVLDRFRHYLRPGSQSWRWCLGPVGAALVAASRGEPLPRPSAVRDTTARLAASPTLGHLLAVNGFFVALTRDARNRTDGARLVRWWNEARSRDAAGNLVRPDGHGVWHQAGRVVPFWLEMDLGTEPLVRVAAKLTGYATLGPRRAYPVLIWLPGTVREANLHALLTRAGAPGGVIVATAADDHAAGYGGPSGPVWRVHGDPGRVPLSDLPVPVPDGEPWDG